jgi:hypothetical protein
VRPADQGEAETRNRRDGQLGEARLRGRLGSPDTSEAWRPGRRRDWRGGQFGDAETETMLRRRDRRGSEAGDRRGAEPGLRDTARPPMRASAVSTCSGQMD